MLRSVIHNGLWAPCIVGTGWHDEGYGRRYAFVVRVRGRTSAIADAEQFDHLIDYLLEWCDDPVATASCAAAGERVWQYGGTGTPEIPEFGVCEVASALGMSPNGAGSFTGDILDIRYRLPRLDAALHRGDVDAWRVRKVASATREFTIARAAEADRRLSADTVGDGTPMLGRVSMARLRPDIAEEVDWPPWTG